MSKREERVQELDKKVIQMILDDVEFHKIASFIVDESRSAFDQKILICRAFSVLTSGKV